MTTPRYELKPNEADAALLAAVFTGAGLTALPFIALGPLIILAFTIAILPWGIGVLLLGPPVWFVLHRYTNRNAGWFTLAGGVVTFLGCVVLGVGMSASVSGMAPDVSDYPSIIGSALLLGAVGSIAGLAVWKVGYHETTVEAGQ